MRFLVASHSRHTYDVGRGKTNENKTWLITWLVLGPLYKSYPLKVSFGLRILVLIGGYLH